KQDRDSTVVRRQPIRPANRGKGGEGEPGPPEGPVTRPEPKPSPRSFPPQSTTRTTPPGGDAAKAYEHFVNSEYDGHVGGFGSVASSIGGFGGVVFGNSVNDAAP